MESADSIYAKAQSKLKSARGGFNFFGNRRDKLEDAAEEFRNAANRYMGEQKHETASACFVEVAKIQNEIDEGYDAAMAYVEASKCMNAADLAPPVRAEKAADLLSQAITYFTTTKVDYYRAAKLQEQLVAILESGDRLQRAIKECKESGKNYDYGQVTASATGRKMYLKAAELSAKLGMADPEEEFVIWTGETSSNYENITTGALHEAINLFEKVAAGYKQSGAAATWTIKECYFKAALCWLMIGCKKNEVDSINMALTKYCEMDKAFPTYLEYGFVLSLVQAIEKKDREGFVQIRTTQSARFSTLPEWAHRIFAACEENFFFAAPAPFAYQGEATGEGMIADDDDGEIDLS
ncbi:soluble NSF attachment protein [Pyronema omphalodes]|nr:soluble NSF attachment protein [Pyronema omphalodes]